MSVRDLIERYAGGTHLHVRVNVVREYMMSGELAIKDRIRFIGVEIDVNVLRGFIHQYIEKPLNGSALRPGACADIYYDRRQPIEWQRLVCCKELLHLMDPDSYKTNTPAHVHKYASSFHGEENRYRLQIGQPVAP